MLSVNYMMAWIKYLTIVCLDFDSELLYIKCQMQHFVYLKHYNMIAFDQTFYLVKIVENTWVYISKQYLVLI